MTDQTVNKILLFEDNPVDAKLISKMLHKNDAASFKIECHNRLSEGLKFLADNEIHTILLDLNLPDSQGMDTFAEVHKIAPSTPVIVLTGTDDEMLAIDAVQAGAQDYLVKGQTNGQMLSRSIFYAIERNRLQNSLMALVIKDPLTNLYNRRGLQEILSRELKWLQRGRSNLIVILVDIDNFKHINDSLGHAVGDVMLQEISRKLKATLRETDYLARIGGDEFMILLPETRLAEAMCVAEKLRLGIKESTITINAEKVNVTTSMGVMEVSPTISSIDELLSQTHAVLYKSKHSGKDKVSVVSKGQTPLGDKSNGLSKVIEILRRGGSLRAASQPIMRLADEQVTGYEFLCRLSHEEFDMPVDFFRISMEADILTLVDHDCLRTSVKKASSMPKKLRKHVNLFPSTLINIPVDDLLDEFPVDGRDTFCIEISEQQIIGDPSYLLKQVEALKAAGILIAIDDVGYGNSCLESLLLLNPHIIKIDKKCIIGIGKDKGLLQTLKRLLRIANSLDSEIVAEGIETKEDLKVLVDLGVEYGQGYLWGKPA